MFCHSGLDVESKAFKESIIFFYQKKHSQTTSFQNGPGDDTL
jgi:hypothetical protein